jgi:hypothetical protein
MAGQPSTKGILLAELEANYGVDPTCVAADAILVDAGTPIMQLDMTMVDRPSLRTQPIDEPPVAGRWAWKVAITTELKNGGTAGTPTNLGDLFQAAGLKETDTANDDTYTPDIANEKSVTLVEYDGVKLYEANGVRFGTMKISAAAGERVALSFEGMGLYVAPIDSAIIASPVFDATEPPVFTGGTFTYNAFAVTIRSFEINIYTGLASRTNGAAATGYAGFSHTKYAITGKITVEDETVAAQAWLANLVASDSAAIDITIGTVAGNKIDIDLPRVRARSVGRGEDGGIRTVDIEFSASDSAPGTFGDAIAIKLY